MYHEDIEDLDLELKAEINLWKNKSAEIQYKPHIAVEHWMNFSLTSKYFCKFCHISVYTTTSEQFFSILKMVEKLLRSTMSNGLAILNIHKEIDIYQFVDTFVRKKKGR